jgi:hypothetical protein
MEGFSGVKELLHHKVLEKMNCRTAMETKVEIKNKR